MSILAGQDGGISFWNPDFELPKIIFILDLKILLQDFKLLSQDRLGVPTTASSPAIFYNFGKSSMR